MADTEKPEQLQANGLENGLDDDERTKMRPADIDADVREMERRKRVESIMNSKLFREELERIIELQMKDGNGPAGLLQQISDMMGIQSGKLHTTNMFRGWFFLFFIRFERNFQVVFEFVVSEFNLLN